LLTISQPDCQVPRNGIKAVARSTAQRLGLDLQVIQAADDSTTQSQQLLKIVESSAEARPNAFLVEPLSVTGLRRVAEAAVAKGIAWVKGNSEVDLHQPVAKPREFPYLL
jgi:ABC-type sugar transport system substrate-binding protein